MDETHYQLLKAKEDALAALTVAPAYPAVCCEQGSKHLSSDGESWSADPTGDDSGYDILSDLRFCPYCGQSLADQISKEQQEYADAHAAASKAFQQAAQALHDYKLAALAYALKG